MKLYFKRNLFKAVNWFLDKYRQLYGVCFYKPFFGAYGKNITMHAPTLLGHPHCIYIGDDTIIRKGARIEAIEANNRIPKIIIGKRCNLEQNVHIVAHSSVIIHDDVSITANCAIVDVTHPYHCDSNLKIGSQILDEDSFVEIGAGSFIGIGAVILPNVKLGERCVVGANSVVTKSFPDYSIIAGAPAKFIKQLL